jgi:hypothetical protein
VGEEVRRTDLLIISRCQGLDQHVMPDHKTVMEGHIRYLSVCSYRAERRLEGVDG